MKKPASVIRRFLFPFLLLINTGVALALLFSYMSWYIDPAEYWFFALFGLFYPWLLMANLLFMLLWLFFWKKYIWLSLFTIALGWQQLHALAAFHSGKEVIPPGVTINLMTYNVHGFYGTVNATGTYREEITEFITAEHPDILCLQEYYLPGRTTASMIRQMAETWHLPHYSMVNYYQSRSANGINGLCTFSRFPVISSGTIEFAEGKRCCLYTDINIHGDTIRVFNVHLASLHLDQDDVTFYYQLKSNNTQDVDVRKGLFSILRKLKRAFILRSTQTTLLIRAIDSSPFPVLVCGDMNDSPFSYTYHRFSKHLTDTFMEAGKGIPGHTYDGTMPNYRIDYIFRDDHFKTYRYTRSRIRFSDHYPVQATFLFDKY